jgi:hypothetical protein
MSGCASTDPQPPASTPAISLAPLPSTAPAAGDVVLGEGRDRTGSRTVGDWVTYADHLFIVTVTGEVRQAPGAAEAAHGAMIGRTVKLRVDNVLWSAPDAPMAAPPALALPAAGWVSGAGDATVKVALRGSSRLELGHTYVKAVEWADDVCSDDPARGTWEGLGSGDTIPFDAGVLGAGEFEGRVLTLDEAKQRWRDGEAGSPSVRFAMAGASIDTLIATMRGASPLPEQDHGPAECDLSDR